jgi:hypothetical protein
MRDLLQNYFGNMPKAMVETQEALSVLLFHKLCNENLLR